MKKGWLFVAALTAVISCVHEVPQLAPPVAAAEDPNWIKLEIPTGREAFAIAGDIDKTLLVTTWTKAYFSTDRGKTWNESKDFQGPIPGLLVRNDTTFALQSSQYDRQGNLLGAWDPLYFSPDYGKTWKYYSQYYKQYLDDIKPIGSVQSATGILYSIQSYSTPVTAGSTTAYVNPSEIRRRDTKGEQMVLFPFKHRLINLHLDAQSRLYVAASGGTYQPESNSFYCCTNSMPAIVYVSRQPLP